MSRIIIHNNGSTSEYCFVSGENLLEFLRGKDYSISAPCGGSGRCGKCRVIMHIGDTEKEVTACSQILTSDCEVFLPSETDDISWNETDKKFNVGSGRAGFGAAVDLGTTTVAVSLFDLSDGKELGSTSRWNVQKSCGADVISRIGFCMENGDGLERLCSEIRQQILDMLGNLCEHNLIKLADISEGIIAGNTVMEHIIAGVSPDSIASAPYLPQTYFDKGEYIMLSGIPFYLSPCVAGYVGGDITAGLLASEITKNQKNALFIDVGTNGEIALFANSKLVSCAVASGPAFEGAEISCGMPAQKGAISNVELAGDGLSFEVIGGGEAKGICGSGLLDIVACLLELGYIDESGCLENDEGESELYLTDTVYINQRDIRRLQLAKAAVYAGIVRLCETEKISFVDIDALYLSGGFGTRLNSKSAVRIGMLPKELSDRIIPLGNTSLSGASEALLNPDKRRELIGIKEQCRYLELSSDKQFSDRFIEAMSFPE